MIPKLDKGLIITTAVISAIEAGIAFYELYRGNHAVIAETGFVASASSGVITLGYYKFVKKMGEFKQNLRDKKKHHIK